MLITISGPPGSGKTTAGRLLAERLHMEFVSTGIIFRKMADERGLSLEEFGEMASNDQEIDKELDKRMVALAKEGKDMVLEGRLAGHMVHLNGIKSFKVWIDAHIHTRSERIAGREGKTLDQVKEEIITRHSCERERYLRLYNIDLDSLAVYDCVVNTDDMRPEEVVDAILRDMGEKELV